MNENETVVEETTTTEVVTDNGNVTEAPVTEEKTLLQEVGEWIVLALIIGLIWKVVSLAINGIKKLGGKIKAKIAAKKAAKEAQAQPTEAPVAAPVAAPEATQATPVEGTTENK